MFVAKENRKSHLQLFVSGIPSSRELSSGKVCLGLIHQVPHSVNVLISARRVRTSTTGCSFNGPRCSQSILKVLNTTLVPFLVWKFLK